MNDEPKLMHIKLVSDDEPNSKGAWINVPLRTEHYVGWKETEELYKEDIPAGFHPVSFSRFERNKW